MEPQQPKLETPLKIQPDNHEITAVNSESPPRALPETCRNHDSPPRASTNEPMKKIVTPDRLRVPIAFKHPERYRSPTDAMMSPVTKGLLERSRKASGSLIPPSFTLNKIQELRKPDSGLSSAMKTETTEIKEQQWTKSISSASSSRSSSITSDSSDEHFEIRHFPLPKPSLSAPEAQKQRDSQQIYNSSVSSYNGSSWSHLHLVNLPGYDPNRIPSSVFSKPANSTEWSIASNESLFSIHGGNFNFSTREDHGLGRLSEIPRFEETGEINPVHRPPPLPPVKKPKEYEKETITEISESEIEIDDNEEEEEEMIELESEEEEVEEDMIEAEVLVDIETENTKEKKEVEVVKETKPEDSSSVVSHSPSISCRSDTSTNSIGSFAFPVLQKEDEIIKTPSMEIKRNVSLKRTPEYQLPQSPMRPPQSQPQPYSESNTLIELQPHRKASKKSESQTQSPKASKSGWFSCFKCPSKCGLFK